MPSPAPAFAYAPYYCEENVWKLSAAAGLEPGRRSVVFISNEGRCCAVWCQRAAPREGVPVLWDYHVILVVESPAGALVYDLDTTLELPCEFARYVDMSFPQAPQLDRPLAPMFRVIDAEEFRRTFSSDRSHMREGEGWRAPPPPWPPIATGGTATNLFRYVDVTQPFLGEVFDLDGLRRRFGVPSSL